MRQGLTETTFKKKTFTNSLQRCYYIFKYSNQRLAERAPRDHPCPCPPTKIRNPLTDIFFKFVKMMPQVPPVGLLELQTNRLKQFASEGRLIFVDKPTNN